MILSLSESQENHQLNFQNFYQIITGKFTDRTIYDRASKQWGSTKNKKKVINDCSTGYP